MPTPLVTAIVSTYRAERFMRGCLEDLLAQTLGDELEIVVIDSASPQGEGAIVRAFQASHPNLRYLRTQSREETTAAFNRALAMARGRYLTTANTDDRHRSDFFEVMVRVLDDHPEFGIAYADSLVTTVPNETFASSAATRSYQWPDYTHTAALSCCLFGAQPVWRHSAHEVVGTFATEHLFANDQDMFMRIAWRFGAVHVQESLGLFLQRPDSNSGADHRADTLADVMAVMRKYRRAIPLEDLFPAMTTVAPSELPVARAAALFELGNLCALGPYNDPRHALELYGRALEEAQRGVSDPAVFHAAYANNCGCVLATLGLDAQARQALALATDLPVAAVNRERLTAAVARGLAPSPSAFDFVEMPHEVVRASRRTRGLQIDRQGKPVWSPLHEQVPWKAAFGGPDGTQATQASISRPAASTSGHRLMLVGYGWADSGGGTMLPRQVAHGFAARGHAVAMFHAVAQPRPTRPAYALDHWYEGDVELFGLCNRPSLFMDTAAPEREIDDPRIRATFAAVLAQWQPDVVHFFNLHNLGMSLAGVCRNAQVPTVLSSNNYWAVCPRLYLVNDGLERCPGAGAAGASCSSCLGTTATETAHAERQQAARRLLNTELDAHLAVSARVRELYVQNGTHPDAIRVLLQQPQSVDAIWQRTGATRAEVERLDRPLRVGYIGSILPHKGVHVLVRALQDLPPDSVQAVLHGDVDARYARQLIELDRTKRCRFAGRYTLDQLPDHLAEIDVVVVPSIWEDCAPYVVAEALASRAPVIGSRIGGIPDFLQPGTTGFLFEPGSTSALRHALAAFLEDVTLLGRMQTAIAPPRGFGAYLDDLLEVYREVCARGHEPREEAYPLKPTLPACR